VTTRRDKIRESVSAHPHVVQSLSLLIALVIGFGSTWSDNAKRLDAIEKGQKATIKTLTSIERYQLDQEREILAHDSRLVALERDRQTPRSNAP
jgi:hypothetical protein